MAFSRRDVASRRALRSGSGGPSAPQPRTEYSAITQLSTANYWLGTGGQGPAGSASMTVGVLWRKTTSGNLAADHSCFDRFTSNTRGYQVRVIDGTQGRTVAQAVSGAPANVAEVHTLATITQNAVYRLVLVVGSNTVSSYLNGSLQSAASAITGFTAATTEAPRIGFGGGVASDELQILAVVVANATALDAAAVSAWDTQVKAGGDLTFASGTTHLWDAADIAGGASWVDQIAGVSLARTGAPTEVSFTAAWA